MNVKYEILVIRLHYWKAKKSSVETCWLICEIEGPDMFNQRTARRYLQKLENGQKTYENTKILVDQRLLIIVA